MPRTPYIETENNNTGIIHPIHFLLMLAYENANCKKHANRNT